MKVTCKNSIALISAFILGASLAVVACEKKDDDDETETAPVATGALVLQLTASCDGSPCI